MNDAIFLREVSGAGRLPSREARAPFIDNGRLAVLGDVSLHAGPALMVEPRSRCCGGRIGACCHRRLRVRTQETSLCFPNLESTCVQTTVFYNHRTVQNGYGEALSNAHI